MYSSALRIDEHPELPPHAYTPEAEPALQVRAVFNGVLIGTRLLPEAASQARSRHGLDPKTNYVIGQSPSADAPAAAELLDGADLPLVSKWGASFLVSVTPRMTGDVSVGGKVYRLADYVAGRGSNFTLPPDGHARIQCGAMSFRLDRTRGARQLPRRWVAWNWQEQKFTLGSMLALALLLGLCFAAPPDGATASGDLLGMNRKFLPSFVTAPQPEKAPESAATQPDQNTGAAGQAHVGAPGRMGTPTSKRQNGAYAIKGNGIDMHTGKVEAAAAARNAGFLGILNSTASAQFADMFGQGVAVGDAPENLLGNLVGNGFAEAYATGGFGVSGTGAGGGGFGLDTLGTARYGTLGHGGYGRGPSIGGLARRPPRWPVVTQGIAHVSNGSLDKDIIRRIVHLHMNEVKYCYDQELVKKASLEGRVSIQFVISPQGQVISSVLQSTTMNNLHVEKCVVDAVKRWPFPAPTGGGIAIVSYPFSFVAGAGG
jgi:TonB family protein